MPVGYSRRSLVEKLGIQPGMSFVVLGAPPGYDKTLGRLPEGARFATQLRGPLKFIHFFAKERKVLESRFAALKKALAPDGALWISWPKGASRIPTDLSDNIVREVGLRRGLVDIKVCAVDETWSGLRFVYRVKDRKWISASSRVRLHSMTKGPHPGRRRIPEITSSANPLLKTFRKSLAEGVSRQGWLAVEGPFLIEEALRASECAHIHSVLVSEEGLERLKTLVERLPHNAEVSRVSDALFRRVAETEAPQGIAALVELKRPALDAILRTPQVLLVVACGLQDPGNLGTIHRSTQAFGASALVTLEATVSPFNPKAMRASAGAVFHVPSFAGAEPGALFAKLRSARVRMIAADPHSPKRISDAELRGPLAILIGQEAAGLSPEIASQADLKLSVPLRAGMDSLNAATAASIFLYEAARQRVFRY